MTDAERKLMLGIAKALEALLWRGEHVSFTMMVIRGLREAVEAEAAASEATHAQ